MRYNLLFLFCVFLFGCTERTIPIISSSDEPDPVYQSQNFQGTYPSSVSGSLLMQADNLGIFRDTSHVKYP